MNDDQSDIAKNFWNYCHILRDDGVSYGDYVEQLTYLLFLKMADEHSRPPFNRPSMMPKGIGWQEILSADEEILIIHYNFVLQSLSKESGILGTIFHNSQNKIQDPIKLRRLINLIDSETWSGIDIDIKGKIYEDLLERNAEDVKSGAGQYFTPRPLIKAIVDVIHPAPGEIIYDPACGTGGFLLAAYDFVKRNYILNDKQEQFLKLKSIKGKDIVEGVVRLCAMNLYLREIGGEESPIELGDSLISDPDKRFDIILTNPPFGRKSSFIIARSSDSIDRSMQTYNRKDFWATTSNKQLNFLQHVRTLLKIDGRAAIIVPDNILFEGGAGETVRRKLLQDCDVHTLLRLPTGVFYAQGVKANVLFFDRKPASKTAWTEKLWIYDLRTNQHFTLKTNPLKLDDLQDFIKCYNPENRHNRKETERFRAFSYDELMQRDKASLDIFWLKDESLEDSENLPDPEVLAREIVESLEAALVQFRDFHDELNKTPME
jgi:type I restriction enzyme M protein